MEIRRLTSHDTAAILRLRDAAGWNQTEKDIHRLLVLEPEGCFAACCDGRIVGTTTTTTYGTMLAWIGMVLVDPEYRRRGIATTLMRAALDYLNGRGVATIKLDASAAGRPVYERFGFEAESRIERWGGTVPLSSAAPLVRRGRWEDVVEVDRVAFGADRRALLRMLIADTGPPRTALAGEDKLAGYALARLGARANYIGPVVASDASVAQSLISAAATRIGGGVVIDIDPSFPGATELMIEFGFVRQREFVRMRLGPSTPFGSPRVFAIACPAVG